MSKMIIIDIDFGSENTLTCLYNDVYTTINFNDMNDLIKEIIFRTCKIDELKFDIEREYVKNKNNIKVIQLPNEEINNIDIGIKQYIDIYIIPTKSELCILADKLLSKKLRVNKIQKMNVNTILPHILNINYSINENKNEY